MTDSKEDGLLACPFCGAHLQRQQTSSGHWHEHMGEVEDCYATGSIVFDENIAAWNRRASSPPVGGSGDVVAWDDAARIADKVADEYRGAEEGSFRAGVHRAAVMIARRIRSKQVPYYGSALAAPVTPEGLSGGDGWIEWKGRGRPAFDDDRVFIRQRGGSEFAVLAGTVKWSHDGRAHDIIAYRLAKTV